MLAKHADKLSKAKIGLVVCDEAHRLKNKNGNKTTEALRKIPTLRRVLLTGTPIQNNLSELYAMVSFANEGCLGTLLFSMPCIFQRISFFL